MDKRWASQDFSKDYFFCVHHTHNKDGSEVEGTPFVSDEGVKVDFESIGDSDNKHVFLDF